MTERKLCAKCGTATAGPGGILCPPCLAKIEAVKLPESP